MAVAKSKAKIPTSTNATAGRQKPKIIEIKESTPSSRISPSTISELLKFRPSKMVVIAAVIIIIAIFVSYKKDWFIAATVNNSPITNWEVMSRLNANYRKQTIDQLVSEKLILSEASKKGVKVTNQDIDNKIKEFETQVGGAETLNNLLAQQGQTREELRHQVYLQLSVDKMYAGEASVSAEEIAKFIEANKDQMSSTGEAELTKEAADIIKQQKLSQTFSTEFQKIKQAAKIQIF